MSLRTLIDSAAGPELIYSVGATGAKNSLPNSSPRVNFRPESIAFPGHVPAERLIPGSWPRTGATRGLRGSAPGDRPRFLVMFSAQLTPRDHLR